MDEFSSRSIPLRRALGAAPRAALTNATGGAENGRVSGSAPSLRRTAGPETGDAPHTARRRRRHTLAARLTLAAAVAVVAAGCGSTQATHTTAAVTKAAYVRAANAICEKADPALATATFKLAALHGSPAAARFVHEVFVPAVESQIDAIGAIPSPAADRATVARMVALVKAGVARLERDPALGAAGVFQDFADVAHPFGLTACAPLS